MATRISDHFTLEEFSQKDGRAPYPPEWRDDRLPELVDMLEKIRAHFGGRAITVTSGYRSPSYNEALYAARGEKPTDSQHSYGRAADILVQGVSGPEVRAGILAMYNAGELPELGGIGIYADGSVHVDIREGDKLATWFGKGVDKAKAVISENPSSAVAILMLIAAAVVILSLDTGPRKAWA